MRLGAYLKHREPSARIGGMNKTPFFAAALLASALPMFVQAAPNVDAQSAKILTAVRGVILHRPLASVTSLHLIGSESAAGLTATYEEWDDVTHMRFATAAVGGALTGAGGWDGTSNWVKDPTGLVHIDAGKASRIQAIDQMSLATLAFLKPNAGGATIIYEGRKSEAGATYDILKLTPHGGSEVDLWVNRATHLIDKESGSLGNIVFTTKLTDYRNVDGLMYPFVQTVDLSTGNNETTTLTSVEIGKDVSAQTAVPASSNRDADVAGGTTTVPIQIINNHVYVQAKVNGQGPFMFILDTGGAFIISPDLAAKLKAGSAGSLQIGGVGATTEAAGFTHIDTLQVGSATVKDQFSLVLPIDKGFGVAEGMHIDGMIGYEFVARFLTTINYGNQTMTLANLPAQPARIAGATPVPFFFDGTIPNVAITIDGIKAIGVVDTGSRGSLTFTSPFAAAHPELKPSTADGVLGFGIGGPAFAKLGRVASLSVGPFSFSNAIVAYTTQTQGAFGDPLGGQNLGGDIWKRFAVTFDYPHYQMLLAPNAAYSAPFNYDRSGLFLIDNAGAHTVLGVRDGTAGATAGLAKGDVIMSIDGKPAASMTLAQIRTVFSSASGTTIRLHVKNASGERDVTLTLKDYV